MTALNKIETRILRRLLKKMISGHNGQQMKLFSTLYELDEQVHPEDNEGTRRYWYQKWFELAFVPQHRGMGARYPRSGDKVILDDKRGVVTGVEVLWSDGSDQVVLASRLKVVD